jgi:hypothetical protein
MFGKIRGKKAREHNTSPKGRHHQREKAPVSDAKYFSAERAEAQQKNKTNKHKEEFLKNLFLILAPCAFSVKR